MASNLSHLDTETFTLHIMFLLHFNLFYFPAFVWLFVYISSGLTIIYCYRPSCPTLRRVSDGYEYSTGTNGYEPNMNCGVSLVGEWFVTVTYDLETDRDKLTLSSNENKYVLSGHFSRRNFRLSNPKLQFTSDGSGTGKGFTIFFFNVLVANNRKTNPCPTLERVSDGYVYSTGTDGYKNNMNCSVSLDGLWFVNVTYDLETKYDKLMLSSNDNKHVLSGYNSSRSFCLTSPKLQFTSDGSITGRGFNVLFLNNSISNDGNCFDQNPCPSFERVSDGYAYSTGANGYPDNLNCSASLDGLWFVYVTYDLDGGYDQLTLSSNDSKHVLSCYNSSRYFCLTNPKLKFISDGSITGRGFNVLFLNNSIANDRFCSGQYQCPTLETVSSGYVYSTGTNGYENNMNCDVTLDGLWFVNVTYDLERGYDILTLSSDGYEHVLSGHNSSRKFCLTNPKLRFESDHSIPGRGFIAMFLKTSTANDSLCRSYEDNSEVLIEQGQVARVYCTQSTMDSVTLLWNQTTLTASSSEDLFTSYLVYCPSYTIITNRTTASCYGVDTEASRVEITLSSCLHTRGGVRCWNTSASCEKKVKASIYSRASNLTCASSTYDTISLAWNEATLMGYKGRSAYVYYMIYCPRYTIITNSTTANCLGLSSATSYQVNVSSCVYTKCQNTSILCSTRLSDKNELTINFKSSTKEILMSCKENVFMTFRNKGKLSSLRGYDPENS